MGVKGEKGGGKREERRGERQREKEGGKRREKVERGEKGGEGGKELSHPLIGASFACPDRRGDGWGYLHMIGRLHFDLRSLNGQIGTSFGNLLVWLAPGSLILCFGGFFPIWQFNLVR